MTARLDVLMDGVRMGQLTNDEGRLALRYADEYRRDPRAIPLSLSMPLAGGSYGDPVVRPWLWGLLPDNDDVLKRWARSFGVRPKDVFALLGHVGEDCAGAVQFVPSDGADEDTGEVVWLTTAEVADRLRELRTDPTTWAQRAGQGQFSLAGAQAKTALHRQGDRWGIADGRTPTTHILKPSVPGLDDHDVNEHVCLALARELGLTAAHSDVLSFDEERAIVVARYDRLTTSGSVRRVHQEDLCQALGRHPSEKYQADGGPTPREIGKLLARTRGVRAREDIQRFADALILNWLIGGTDAHAKNYSLLLSSSAVRLAPLYDVASALPYEGLDPHRLRLAMKIGHHYELAWIGRSDWLQLAQELRLDQEALVQRALGLAADLPVALAAVVDSPDIAALSSSMPARLVECLTPRAERCARALTTTVFASAALTATSGATATGTALPPSWSVDDAAALLAEVTEAGRALLAAVASAGGSVSAARLKETLGTPTLQGRTSPVTRALRRLQARRSLPPGLQNPLETLYGEGVGRRPVAEVRLADHAREAFLGAIRASPPRRAAPG